MAYAKIKNCHFFSSFCHSCAPRAYIVEEGGWGEQPPSKPYASHPLENILALRACYVEQKHLDPKYSYLVVH